MLTSTISFIYHTNLFKGRKYPNPESTLFVVEEILDFRGGGGEVEVHFGRGQIRLLCKKGAILWTCFNTLLSLIIVFKKLLGDNLSVRYFLYKNLFSLKFERGYCLIKSKKNCVLGLYFHPCLKSILTIVI